MRSHVRGTQDGENGFALVIAILALLVLTFLGLSLVATTSTEQQIASNYRWSQQALYNAEAGIEVGKVLLRDVGGADWASILPVVRATTWTPATGTLQATPAPPPNPATGPNIRNYENRQCDQVGGGVGYGIVLNDTTVHALGPVQYQTNVFGQSLNGAFTLWVRHRTSQQANNPPYVNSDEPRNDRLVLTSEGIAPYTPGAGAAMTSAARLGAAVKVLEVELVRGQTSMCPGGYVPQGGEGPTGAGYDPCSGNLLDQSVAGAKGPLGDTARGANLGYQGGSGGAGTSAGRSGQ